MLNDFSLFITIVETGSLQKTAEKLSIPISTLSRRLQKLESNLNCKLLHRSTRGLKLTAEGEIYYQRCQPIITSLQQHIEEIHTQTNQASGIIRVLAPINLSLLYADFWSQFLAKYPEIDLILSLSNHNENLLETGGADLALRVGKQKDSTLKQKRLASTATGVVASPQYLAKQPPINHPNELDNHHWLVAQPLSSFTLTNQLSKSSNTEKITIRINKARLQVNEIRLCVALAKQGLGLCFLPLNQCQNELESGELVTVLPEWQPPQRDIYAIWQGQKHLPLRVQVLLDELMGFVGSGTVD